LSLLVMLCLPQKVMSFDIKVLSKNLNVNGYISQSLGICFAQPEDWHPVSNYTQIRLEAGMSLTDHTNIYGIFEFTADSIYNMRNDSGEFKKYMPGRKYMQTSVEQYDQWGELVKEFYVDIAAGKVDFRLGKQSIIWGESDGIRLLDQINPLDIRREFVMWDFENILVPKWMVKAEYYPGFENKSLKDLSLEMVWNPGDIQESRIGFASQGTLRGLPYAGPWGYPQAFIPKPIVDGVLSVEKKSTSIDNSEFGCRLKGSIGKTYLTLNYFQGFSHDFVCKYTKSDILDPMGNTLMTIPVGPVAPDFSLFAPGGPFEGLSVRAHLDGIYRRVRFVGFSINRDLSDFILWQQTSPVLRVEALYSFAQSFNTGGDRLTDLAWVTTKGIVKKDQLRFMVGFDWQVWCRFLNDHKTFFISPQFLQFRVIDHDTELVQLPYYFNKYGQIDPWKIPEVQNYFTILVNTGYDNDRILPEALWCHDFYNNAQFIKARVSFSYGDHWRPEIGVHYFTGDTETYKSFGAYDDRDQIYIKIKYQF